MAAASIAMVWALLRSIVMAGSAAAAPPKGCCIADASTVTSRGMAHSRRSREMIVWEPWAAARVIVGLSDARVAIAIVVIVGSSLSPSCFGLRRDIDGDYGLRPHGVVNGKRRFRLHVNGDDRPLGAHVKGDVGASGVVYQHIDHGIRGGV